MAIVAVLAGFGIACVMSYMAAPHLATGWLETVLTDYETATLAVHVIHHEGRRANRKVRAFLELAIATLRSDTAIK
jgi:DNA-binding transcriptional LysR family regulator